MLFTYLAMARHAKVRPNMAPTTMKRRPPWTRSMAGPRNGATTANGAIVRISERATRLRASLSLMLKNSDPARARVTRASPPADNRWATANREKGVGPRSLDGVGGAPAGRAGFFSSRQPSSLTLPMVRTPASDRSPGAAHLDEGGELLHQLLGRALEEVSLTRQDHQLLGLAGPGVDVVRAQVGEDTVVLAVDEEQRRAGQP